MSLSSGNITKSYFPVKDKTYLDLRKTLIWHLGPYKNVLRTYSVGHVFSRSYHIGKIVLTYNNEIYVVWLMRKRDCQEIYTYFKFLREIILNNYEGVFLWKGLTTFSHKLFSQKRFIVHARLGSKHETGDSFIVIEKFSTDQS